MAIVLLGNSNAIEMVPKYRDNVEPTDPDLDAKWAEALDAGQVSEDGLADESESQVAAIKAARLTAIRTQRDLGGDRITTINTVSDFLGAMKDICESGGVVEHHFAPGEKPAWVESDNPVLAQALAEHYGIPVGRPDTWED